jgi:hypothetical protein
VRARFEGYFPGIDFDKFGGHSSTWPIENVRALGSEYTSAPWDNRPGGVFVDSAPWGRFVVEPSGGRNREVRNPAVAGVSLVKGGAPYGPALKSKTVGEKEVHYRVTKSDGGSGGEVYTLEVYERVEGGHVRYTQAAQSEMGEPDFALCWTLVGSTKYQQPKNN